MPVVGKNGLDSQIHVAQDFSIPGHIFPNIVWPQRPQLLISMKKIVERRQVGI